MIMKDGEVDPVNLASKDAGIGVEFLESFR